MTGPDVPTAVVADDGRAVDVDATVVAVPMWPGEGGSGPWLGEGAAELNALGVDLFGALERDAASGRAGQVVSVPAPGKHGIERVLLVGLGDGSTGMYRRAGAAIARAARGVGRLASTVSATASDAGLRAFVEGALLAPYALRVPAGGKAPLRELVLAATGSGRSQAVDRGRAVAVAGWIARDLVHTPASVKDPEWLAAQARQVADGQRLGLSVRDEKALAAEGFGGIVAVGMGSVRPPRLIELTYSPADIDTETPRVVLIGKGITFDSGGLSLKPRDAMVPMKTDMSGGAVVVGVLSALRDLGCRVAVTGLVAAAENMPSGSAQRPGDVVRQYDGTTVEVLNTDAEGRLVLADTIGYAAATLDPAVIVDVATLTGAATLGLGRRHAALYTSSDPLAAALTAAGEAAGERLWRMPLVDDYRESLESAVADVAHVETRKMGGGSITAALFLQRFARDVPWAHIDIAGPGRADADEHEVVKGGTAFGTRALLYWLETAQPADPAIRGLSREAAASRRR
ncbi:MAG TPA: leucyl aminopeptidase [Jiangellaceae bacterium]|nr:leucyl aminopeptidase [Jiangellaceae bacterium]